MNVNTVHASLKNDLADFTANTRKDLTKGTKDVTVLVPNPGPDGVSQAASLSKVLTYPDSKMLTILGPGVAKDSFLHELDSQITEYENSIQKRCNKIEQLTEHEAYLDEYFNTAADVYDLETDTEEKEKLYSEMQDVKKEKDITRNAINDQKSGAIMELKILAKLNNLKVGEVVEESHLDQRLHDSPLSGNQQVIHIASHCAPGNSRLYGYSDANLANIEAEALGAFLTKHGLNIDTNIIKLIGCNSADSQMPTSFPHNIDGSNSVTQHMANALGRDVIGYSGIKPRWGGMGEIDFDLSKLRKFNNGDQTQFVEQHKTKKNISPDVL
ncbi:hypothetical protein [Aeromonas jandaei]